MFSCCKTESNPSDQIKLYPVNFYLPLENKSKPSKNVVRTTKYLFYNFIFLNLFEQFKRYSNIFFLFCVILNFIPVVNAFSQGTAVLPLLFILLTTLIKDGVEDLRRYVSDKKVNSLTVLKYDEISNKFVPNQWKNIRVGDFVQLSSNERIPADLLIYYSSDLTGVCFIETADIDGETTLKQRTIVKPIDSDYEQPEYNFRHYYLEVEPPNKEIYKFNGNLIDSRTEKCVRSLKSSNMILRDTILRNTNEVRGIVIYAGNETKVFMNNDKARFKRSLLEEQLNTDMLICLILLLILCIMTGIGYTVWLNGYTNFDSIVYFIPNTTSSTNVYILGFYQFWTGIIVFQSIIPIALYITLEFVKAHQVLHITNDLTLYDEELNRRIDVKAYNVTEDIGQIKHMFCDKTGTLTDNVMIFRKSSIYGNNYETNGRDLMLKCINKDKDKPKSMAIHITNFLLSAAICNTTILGKTVKKEKKLVYLNEDKESVISTSTKLSMSEPLFPPFFDIDNKNYVTIIEPVILEDSNPIPMDITRLNPEKIEISQSVTSFGSKKNSQNLFHRPLTNEELFPMILSESPDEDALVKMVIVNGYKLHHRSNDRLLIWNDIDKKWINFDILKTLPFDSVRKCMSVIVRHGQTNVITLYCKGADSTMFPKMVTKSQEDQDILNNVKSDLFSFACDGLRTLVMGQRILNESEFQKWEEMLMKAEENLINNENAIKEVFDLIENNLTLLGAVGLEDKLQEFVPEVLECFREAGINIWILTGDKKETAISIAHSTNLFFKNDILLEITCDNKVDLLNQITSIRLVIEKSIYKSTKSDNNKSCNHDKFGLVIDGCSLSLILGYDEPDCESLEDLKDLFLHVAHFCDNVVCCRCTPIQKGEVVKLIKTKYKVRTLAIGDGANDVNMIQTADIGVGISGKEGSQATMASDFAITKFKHLKKLVFVHGHWSYDKLARMSLFMFYKDMFISMVLYLYQFVCGFSVSRAIDQITQITFHIIQTGLPPIIYGIWDKDFSDMVLMANPQIYKTGINCKMYRPRDFWRNIVDAIWQSLCVFVIPWLCYNNTEVDMGEFGIVSVSCCIIAMFAHILIECKHWNPFNWIFCVGSLVIGFYLELFIFNNLCVVVFDCQTDNPYKVLQYTMARGKTYLMIALTSATALFPRLFFKGYLLNSRNSIFYEAHRRMTKLGISKSTSNVFSIRIDNENECFSDYKSSKYYLGNLEEFKSVDCEKCMYKKKYFNENFFKLPANYHKSQVVPYEI